MGSPGDARVLVLVAGPRLARAAAPPRWPAGAAQAGGLAATRPLCPRDARESAGRPAAGQHQAGRSHARSPVRSDRLVLVDSAPSARATAGLTAGRAFPVS
ncbi:hypothetical protein ACSFA0_23480 [Variovorax sp. LT1P1]|uniref:hypothetical protein n=1 Tax=Variovorax sp. LT1P1 TaxID=3443730 RepID=UPI003F47FE4D